MIASANSLFIGNMNLRVKIGRKEGRKEKGRDRDENEVPLYHYYLPR